MPISKKIVDEIRKEALLNAKKHGGKANPRALAGKFMGSYPELRKDVPAFMKEASKIVAEVNKLSPEAQAEEMGKLGVEVVRKERKTGIDALPELPNAVKGKVVTAYPPEPSKFPHIGHAYSSMINFLYAKRYGGKFILRFEDTNPTLAKDEFYKAQAEAYEWLGIDMKNVMYASDYIEKLYKAAEKIIKSGDAYVCTCDGETTSKNRRSGTDCACRSLKPSDNMARWNDMLSGKLKRGEASMRIKIDMKHKNAAMRDPGIMRIMDEAHPRTKAKFKVWPTYVFQTALLDGWSGVTHRYRSKEFEPWKEPQQYIQKLFKLNVPYINEYARVNLISDVPSSGRKIRELIQQGKFLGWDDPRLTTIAALKRRGFTPQGIINFVLSVGVSKTEANLPWDTLYAANRKVLDAEADRFHFVEKPVEITIPGNKAVAELPVHPDFPKKGKRKVRVGEKILIAKNDAKILANGVRLKDLFNVKKKGSKIEVTGTKMERGIPVIQWVPADTAVKCRIMMDDAKWVEGVVEPDAKKLKVDDKVQFVRFGFCRLDKKAKDALEFWYTHK